MSIEKKILWTFPVPSTELSGDGDVCLLECRGDTLLLFELYGIMNDDKLYNAGLLFRLPQAYRHCDEMFCGETAIEAYDQLIEIVDSDWVDEFRKINREIADYWKLRHFAIYLKSCGLYEFLARSYTILETKSGGLTELHSLYADLRAK